MDAVPGAKPPVMPAAYGSASIEKPTFQLHRFWILELLIFMGVGLGLVVSIASEMSPEVYGLTLRAGTFRYLGAFITSVIVAWIAFYLFRRSRIASHVAFFSIFSLGGLTVTLPIAALAFLLSDASETLLDSPESSSEIQASTDAERLTVPESTLEAGSAPDTDREAVSEAPALEAPLSQEDLTAELKPRERRVPSSRLFRLLEPRFTRTDWPFLAAVERHMADLAERRAVYEAHMARFLQVGGFDSVPYSSSEGMLERAYLAERVSDASKQLKDFLDRTPRMVSYDLTVGGLSEAEVTEAMEEFNAVLLGPDMVHLRRICVIDEDLHGSFASLLREMDGKRERWTVKKNGSVEFHRLNYRSVREKFEGFQSMKKDMMAEKEHLQRLLNEEQKRR